MKGKNMTKIFRTLLVLALIVGASMLSTTPARAQSVYGSIIGTITDKTGAAIPGATVTIKDEAKGTIVTVTSNASGDYNVPHLIPDVYDLKVSMKGYNTFETVGIQVEADTAPRIDPTLGVGSVETTVEVSAESQPELKTVSSDVSTVFDQQQVSSLPVGDQNFTNLQLLLPGAQLLGWSHAADENPQASKQIQVDGQAFGGTAFELDGTDNEDPILGIGHQDRVRQRPEQLTIRLLRLAACGLKTLLDRGQVFCRPAGLALGQVQGAAQRGYRCIARRAGVCVKF